jgi:plasmid stabilization system protein ParE
MRVVFTPAALADLDDLLFYTSANYPDVVPALERRIRAVLDRIEQWPESAREVSGRTVCGLFHLFDIRIESSTGSQPIA